ncbi:unnamed protein product [Dracunculus medinensis]|uniref:PIP49_C domain-containing protein n=1 Tax=Dracunculus medinensis TaxID=318479 RepID=A0A0N4UGY9_DRAME|nr:unnamed protein product [Dracunculus medinensis]
MKNFSAHSLLVNLCNAYKARKVNGDLCNRLCFGDDWVILHLYEGNKVVITLKLSSQEVVLKSQHATIDEFEQLDPRILDIVNYNLRLGWPSYYKKHLMEIIWPMYARKNGFLSESDRRSLWTLVSQEEYITFRMLPLSRVTPKVIGTCGHFYQVEHLVPFRMKGYYMNLKAKILVHLMGMLKLFDEFLNEPLQWCDVKFDNLALAAEYPKRFMVMDADMLYTKSRLDSILTSRHCINDTDCSFFDCESRCNTTVGFCSRRLNNNVDVMCNKLVFQLFGKFWTKSNRYLAACHDRTISTEQRLADLRLAWSWNLPDV